MIEYNGTNRRNDKKEGKERGKLMRHWKQIKKERIKVKRKYIDSCDLDVASA